MLSVICVQCCASAPHNHASQTKIKIIIRIVKREEKENKIRWSKNEGWKHISFKRRFLSYLPLQSALPPSHPTSTRLLTTATTTPDWNRLVSIWEILGHLKQKSGFLQKKWKMAPNLWFERPSGEDTAENLCFSGQYITKVQSVRYPGTIKYPEFIAHFIKRLNRPPA
jgi:hypothetical protein